MMFLQFLLLLSPIAIALAQVDPGLGTFQCYPCGRSDCYLSDSNKNIQVPDFGSQKCTTFQQLADDRELFPDDCADIQTVTLASSNPCSCKKYGGGACPDPGYTNTATCNLCGSGNKRIGDPDKIIKGGILNQVKCIDVFDNPSYFSTRCSAASALVTQQCQCLSTGQSGHPCTPVEDINRQCNPNASNTCCDGSCKWLNQKNAFVCTTRNGQTPPNGQTFPDQTAPPPPVTCFSGDMKVQTAAKGSISMKDLTIGDRVLVGDNKFDTVYSFGHRSESKEAKYLSIVNDKSSDTLELSKDHMVFREEGQAVPAAALEKGDTMLLPSGELATILRINTVTRKGAYAPFTYSGALVVNGVVASSFIGMQEMNEHLHIQSTKTPLTLQWLAHVFETPHRMAYRLGLVTSDTYSADGVSQWVALPYSMGKWIVAQSTMIQLLILVPTVVIMAPVWCVEQNLLLAAASVGLMLLLARRSRISKTL